MEAKIYDTLLHARFLVENGTINRFISTIIIVASLFQNYGFLMTIIESEYHYNHMNNIFGWVSPTKFLNLMGFTNYIFGYLAISLLFLALFVINYAYLYMKRDNLSTKSYFMARKTHLNAFLEILSFFNNSGFILLIYGFLIEIAIAPLTCSNRFIFDDYRISTYYKDIYDVCNDKIFKLISFICIFAAFLGFIHSLVIALFNTTQRFLANNKLSIHSRSFALWIVIEKTVYAILGLYTRQNGMIKSLLQFLILTLSLIKVLKWNKKLFFLDVHVSKVYLMNQIFFFLVLFNSFWSQLFIFNTILEVFSNTYIYFLIILIMCFMAFKFAQRLEKNLILNNLNLQRDNKNRHSILYLYYYLIDSDIGNGKIIINKKDENTHIIMTFLRSHIKTCDKPNCICSVIRSYGTIYDQVTKTFIDFSNEADNKRYYSNFIFLRELIIEELLNEINSYKNRKESILILLNFYIFECNNLYKAYELIKPLKSMQLTFIDKFELGYIKRAFDRYFKYDMHHKYNGDDYLIVEKFTALSKAYTSIQEDLIHVLDKFHSIIILLVS